MAPVIFLGVLAAAGGPAARAGEKVGVYDSRLVAFACFSRPEHQAELKRLMAEGKAAQERGDAARYQEIKKQVTAAQRALHLQVFSTAPIPDALAQLADKRLAVEREAGVRRLVSKWDEDGLEGVAEADRIDVTELLVRDFALNERQRETMRQLAGKEPMPLWRAKLLGFFAKD
jgi:hypothetical protein